MSQVLGVGIALLGLSCFWLARMGRSRADPKNLVGGSSLVGLLFSVLPERCWPLLMTILGSGLLVFDSHWRSLASAFTGRMRERG